MGNWALTWLANHQQWLQGVALGIVLSNPITCGIILFNLALKIPGFGPWVAKNPDEAKSWFEGFSKGVDQAVDKYVATQAKGSPAPQPALPAPAPSVPPPTTTP